MYVWYCGLHYSPHLRTCDICQWRCLSIKFTVDTPNLVVSAVAVRHPAVRGVCDSTSSHFIQPAIIPVHTSSSYWSSTGFFRHKRLHTHGSSNRAINAPPNPPPIQAQTNGRYTDEIPIDHIEERTPLLLEFDISNHATYPPDDDCFNWEIDVKENRSKCYVRLSVIQGSLFWSAISGLSPFFLQDCRVSF